MAVEPTGIGHHDILRREFERIAQITDEAFHEMNESEREDAMPSKLLSASYKDWAGLLLRYHDAIERISKSDEDTRPSLPTMKDSSA